MCSACGFALVCVYPMWYVLVASVTPYEEYVKGGMMLWPTGGIWTSSITRRYSAIRFCNSLWISVSKTVVATALSVLVTSTMAYAVSKVHVPGMKLINALVVFNLFFTGGLILSICSIRTWTFCARTGSWSCPVR
ncbi:MAG: hypothetical protein V8T36_00305 [Ruthenibacterium lactatiformans]